jgi:dolichol-phosphate mannosyltransferase
MNDDHIDISVVVPMYNESANVPANLRLMQEALRLTGARFEIIPVDDGSTDDTMDKLHALAARDGTFRPTGYPDNSGRGRALRVGIRRARGRYILTTDADLSYSEAYLPAMYELLQSPSAPDMVVGSPYMNGGGIRDVPLKRLFISRVANVILSRILPGKIKTVTGILRGYRAEAIRSLDLEANGKEIHLEILSKGIAAGFRIMEFPAVLTGRQRGKSKFRFKATAYSHILFSFFEKPSILFGLIGTAMILTGMVIGGYLIYLWQHAALNPNRPLMTLMVIVLVAGMQVLLFGFIGSLLVILRREIFRVQRRQGEILQRLDRTGPESREREPVPAHKEDTSDVIV